MRIFLSVLLVVLISMAAAPFTSGAYAPDTLYAPVSQNVYLIQTTSDKENAPPSQPTVPLDQYLSQLKQDIKDYASLNTAIVTYGLTGLGVVTAIIALGAGGIAYFTTRTYRIELREKKNIFAKYEGELKQLVEQGKEHLQYFKNLIRQSGPTEAFSENVIKEAREKIRTGTGSEVLWGKAILAQEDKQWDKAYTYWTSILEDEADNTSALFGAALACAELFEGRNYDPACLSLVDEGLNYLKRIPHAQINAPVLNRWGRLLYDQSCAETDLDKKTDLQERALNNYRKATKCDPTYPNPWSNLGGELGNRARKEPDPARKAELYQEAEEKISKAIQCDPTFSHAWNNWGLLLSDQAGLETDSIRKAELQEQAIDKYRTATECDPKYSGTWNSWGLLLANQAKAEEDPTRKAKLQEQAADKYRTATECDPKYSFAWNNWGNLLADQEEVEKDPTRKAKLQEQATDKYRTATECNPKFLIAWNNWGILLNRQAEAETDPARKAELQEQAKEKFRRAEECSNSK